MSKKKNEITMNDLVAELEKRGYTPPLAVQTIMDGQKGGTGDALVQGLEYDRRNVYDIYFGKEKGRKLLEVAHTYYLDGREDNTISPLYRAYKREQESKVAKNNNKEGGRDDATADS